MAKFTKLSLEQYLTELSSNKSVPGGGSVSAYVAALAMGLSQMVAGIALKRKKKTSMTPEEEEEDNLKRETLQKLHDGLEESKQKAFAIVDSDPEVYEEVMAAWGNEDKQEEALFKSYGLQAELCNLIVEGKEANTEMVKLVKGSIKNDLIVSSGLFKGAFLGAFHTAMINVVYFKEEARKAESEKSLQDLKGRFEKGGVDVGQSN